MRRSNTQEFTTEQLVESFAAIAVEQDDAILHDDTARYNKLFRRMMLLEQELKNRRGDQRRQLLRLYDHPNMQVRLAAARATLAVAPQAGRKMLAAIAASRHFPQAGDAGMSLRHLDNGIYNPT